MNQTSPTCIQTQRLRLQARRERLIHNFSEAAAGGKQKRLTQLFGKIRQTNEFIATLSNIESDLEKAEAERRQTRRRYTVSSLFLHECYKKLTADRDEQFFFITGAEISGTFVLDQAIEFAHQKRSLLGVTGDSRATHKLLIRLEQFGHRLLAHFHSHPGNGSSATNPSGIDEGFQQRLQKAGHVAVMAIFSRDGYVRFIRLEEDLDIEIYGTGVEQHEKTVYRLTNIDQA